MTAIDVVMSCAREPEFVGNWARLRGIVLPASPMDQMIDEATGNDSAIARQFIADVFDIVIGRCPQSEA